MKVLKKIFKIFIEICLTISFFVLAFLEKTILFYSISIVLVAVILYKIIKNILKMKKEKNKYVRRIFSIIINIVSVSIIIGTITLYREYEGNIYNFIIESLESKEYNEKFTEVNYKNYKILYNENNKGIIKLIERYLDEVEDECKKLFNIEGTSALTIKFDYDESVFRNRQHVSENTIGYYITKNKTIYIYVQDAYLILSNNNNFKETFFHECTHHYIRECLKLNNVKKSKMPAWFDEGVSEYVANAELRPIKCADGLNTEFIPLSKIEDSLEWKLFDDGTNYMQSEYMINKITEKKGKQVISLLIKKMENSDFETAFKEAIGYSLAEFEQEIKNDINNSKDVCEHFHERKEAKKYYAEKIEAYESYIRNNINNIDAYISLAGLYNDNGNRDKAIAVINAGLNNNPSDNRLENVLDYYIH